MANHATTSDLNDVSTSSTLSDNDDHYHGILNPIHYIVLVLMFYMGGLTILIIKYIQSENEESRYERYYVEYVKRSQFDKPNLMKKIRNSRQDQPNQPLAETKLLRHDKDVVEIAEENVESRKENFSLEIHAGVKDISTPIFSDKLFEFSLQQSLTRAQNTSSEAAQPHRGSPANTSHVFINIKDLHQMKSSDV